MMKECLEHFLVNPSIFQKVVAKALPPSLPRERQICIQMKHASPQNSNTCIQKRRIKTI
jgi:hypothetical protein